MTEPERRNFLKTALASLAGITGIGIPGCGKKSPEDSVTAMCYSMPMPEEFRKKHDDETPDDTDTPEPAPDDAADDKTARREELTEK